MSEESIPILQYAATQPRSLRRKLTIAAVTAGLVGASGTGVAITIHRMRYQASQAQRLRLTGTAPAQSVNWQSAGAAPSSASSSESAAHLTRTHDTTGVVEVP